MRVMVEAGESTGGQRAAQNGEVAPLWGSGTAPGHQGRVSECPGRGGEGAGPAEHSVVDWSRVVL